jgi:large subunit ribosomal protein L32e
MKKFLRRNTVQYSRLGRNRRKKQIWRKPKGRHNKMREKRRGYSAIVKIGYKKNNEERGKIEGKKIFLIRSLNDLSKMKKNEVGKIGKIGKKKKIEIIAKAKESGIILYNLNMEKYLKNNKLKERKLEEKINK